jgi:hypothetical protein
VLLTRIAVHRGLRKRRYARTFDAGNRRLERGLNAGMAMLEGENSLKCGGKGPPRTLG